MKIIDNFINKFKKFLLKTNNTLIVKKLKNIIKITISRLKPRKFKTLNQIELSGPNLINNFNLIQSQHPKFKIIPVLKSDAYGHGIMQIGQLLNLVKCKMIAVDSYFEALKLSKISNHRILIMGYIDRSNFINLKLRRYSFVIQEAEDIISLGRLNKKVNIHLELNTGMNRLGLQPNELNHYLKTLQRFPKINLEGVMTHLAEADNINNSFTKKQLKSFDEAVEVILKKGFKPKYIHIAQTAGSVKVESKYANAIRLGVGLYGINPLSASDNHFKDLERLLPVLELKTKIIKVQDIQEGDKVSYGGTFVAEKPMRIGILPLGYYEGIPRELSNCGVVSHENTILPIVGRVCMNHTMIDLSDSDLKEGDSITVFSSDPSKPNSIANIAKNHKLFSYSILTGISSTIRRIINFV
jgi:alanine racemase